MGGLEAKRRRALKRAGVDAEVAAATAAKELAERRAAQEQGGNKAKSPAPRTEKARLAKAKKKAREKRKRLAKQKADEDVLAADEKVVPTKEQPVAIRKQKKSQVEDGGAETEGGRKRIKGDPKLTVFVGQLPFTVDERTLEDHFVKAGIKDVVKVRMLTEKGEKKSKGMAFVQLASQEDVEAALELHQSELCGRWINVERHSRGLTLDERINLEQTRTLARQDAEVDRALSVFVAKLPYKANKKSIQEHFETGGVAGVTTVKMLSEKGTNRKGMAFVQFSDEDSVLAALKLDKSQMGDRWIVVERSNKEDAKDKAAAAPDVHGDKELEEQEEGAALEEALDEPKKISKEQELPPKRKARRRAGAAK